MFTIYSSDKFYMGLISASAASKNHCRWYQSWLFMTWHSFRTFHSGDHCIIGYIHPDVYGTFLHCIFKRKKDIWCYEIVWSTSRICWFSFSVTHVSVHLPPADVSNSTGYFSIIVICKSDKVWNLFTLLLVSTIYGTDFDCFFHRHRGFSTGNCLSLPI